MNLFVNTLIFMSLPPGSVKRCPSLCPKIIFYLYSGLPPNSMISLHQLISPIPKFSIFPSLLALFLFLFFKINLFIYLFLAVLGLRFCVRASSSCGERGPLFIVVCGPPTVAASLVAEHRLQMRRLSSCGSRA